MGSFSIWHWIILGLIVVLLFGKGKISDLMGDVAKGIKSFKKGMAEDETAEAKPAPAADPVRTIDQAAPAAGEKKPEEVRKAG